MNLVSKSQKYKKQFLLIIGVLLLTLTYSVNFFDIRNNGKGSTYFPKFQKDSENLIITSVLAQNFTQSQVNPYGLAVLVNNETNKYVYVYEDVNIAKQQFLQTEINTVKPYKSLVGFQGHVINFFYRLGIKNFSVFRLVSAFLMAVALVGVCYMIFKTYNSLLSGIFFITFALSPWLTAFARNLYWVGFLWFLPLLLVLIYQQHQSTKKGRCILLILIGLALFIKSLCGYEYLSTIMITAMIPVVVDFFRCKRRSDRVNIVKTFIKISAVMIIGFVMAFTVHATLRGNGNVLSGAKNIYKMDVKRRMAVGSYSDEVAAVNDSKQALTIEVLKTYMSFNTSLLTGLIEGSSFALILVASFLLLVSDLIKDYKKLELDLIMWVLTLMATLSWFILAKPHSYIHTHINYVLWYFGFIQVSLYVIIKRIIMFVRNYKVKKENYADFSR